MDKLISQQAAIDALCSVCNALGGGHNCDKTKFVYNAPFDEQVILCPEHYALTMLPSAQPEPRTAYWTKDIVGSVVCSNCGGIREDNRIGHTQWCNCCGCFMRGEQK